MISPVHVALPIAEIRRAAADAEFQAAMTAHLASLDARIAARKPLCTNRGDCCRFDTFGHALFVSAPELAWFLARSGQPLLAPADGSFCPYQQGGECTVRAARPAGCRIFYCDAAAQHWQPAESEASLRDLAKIGERYGVPYAYGEWTDALRQLGGRIVQQVPGRIVPISVDIARQIDTDEGSS